AAMALSVDTSFITAWSNDFGFESVFTRQLEALAQENDILFAYSTSGSSPNIVKSIELAVDLGMFVVLFTGGRYDLKKRVGEHITLRVPSVSTAIIQECHTILGHVICSEIEQEIGFK
ncbi:SIS domain-containing protein, partial [Planktomarina temperata]|nr:SIS domain-containing protein [Planktomarina temperata]